MKMYEVISLWLRKGYDKVQRLTELHKLYQDLNDSVVIYINIYICIYTLLSIIGDYATYYTVPAR